MSDVSIGQQRAMPSTVARVHAEGRRAANDLRENYACEICGNIPNEDGELEHGRGCFKVDSDGGGTEYIEMSDPIRDDTTFPGSGPYGQPQATCERTHWEPWPLQSFDMPPPRSCRPHFIAANVAQQVVDAYQSQDREALRRAIDALADAIDPPNQNSGPLAPIQGQ